jgi:hypothetical protein
MDFLHFRVWEGAGLCTHILEGHSDGVTSVSVINPEGMKTKFPPPAAKLQNLFSFLIASCHILLDA